MIKLILWDYDGTLHDCKHIHFEALNKALTEIAGPSFAISEEDHLSKFDGLPTKEKLKILAKEKGLSQLYYYEIERAKLKYTLEAFDQIQENPLLISLFTKLRKSYKVAICSNCSGQSLRLALRKLGIFGLVDKVFANECVKHTKPHPETYMKAMVDFQVSPEETLVFEDSPHGVKAAVDSGANVQMVKNVNELTEDFVFKAIEQAEDIIRDVVYNDGTLNIVIPMSGMGSRFVQAGYTDSKPMIDVAGQTMIERVYHSLKIRANYIFIARAHDIERYNLNTVLKLIAGPNTKVISVDKQTQGAACTVLLAKEFINNENPLIVANADQIIGWSPLSIFYQLSTQNLDGFVLTFPSNETKWSYVKTDEYDIITEVAEKHVISNRATCGVYGFTRGNSCVWAIEEMIKKDIRTNGEFYFFPATEQLIEKGHRIKAFDVEEMNGVGTPEDLKKYLEKL